MKTGALDSLDADAVFAFVVKAHRLKLMKDKIEERIKALKDEKDRNFEQLTLIKASLKVFGFKPDDNNLWDDVRRGLGADRYDEAIEYSKIGFEKGQLGPDIDLRNEQIDRTIKELVVEKLKNCSGKGAKASDIKSYLESHNIKMHEKTVGMTLYRLSKDGVVTRKGRDWFHVSQA